MKFKRILAVLMLIAAVVALAGCNYVSRPSGAANNMEDISSMLGGLLVVPQYDYQDPPEALPDYEYAGPELNPYQDPSTIQKSPFISTFDAGSLMTKIDTLVKAMKDENGPANSATGVSDELLNGRSIKIFVPDDFPIDEENEAVKAMVEQYGCAVNVRRVGTGSAYVAACRTAVLSGDKVDLMYVDNGVWGDVHTFTQPIQSFVNFDLAEEMDTFERSYSEKYAIQDSTDESLVNYYVASGIGSPYLLVYNKENIKSATLKEGYTVINKGEEDEEKVPLRGMNVTDPVEMYNNGTWGINAFTAMLKASTVGSNVGLASEIDRLDGLDVWYGMEDFNCHVFETDTGKVRLVAQEELTPVNKSVDVVQDWYWTIKGADSKNYIGSFETQNYYNKGIVYEKLLNCYTGNDSVKSFSFVGCQLQDLGKVEEVADSVGASWEFVSYPYGQTYEDAYRAMTEEEFSASFASGEEGEIETPVAGWAGGFAVMKTCQNPSVALRVAEEYTKIWKDECEKPFTDLMSDDQLARYEDMKENIGVSFIRSWAEKAADCNATYPDYAQYFYSYDYDGTNVSGGSMHSKDPDVFATHRSYYLGLVFFDGNADLVTHPMYHKDEAASIYNPEVHTSWSGFMDGQPSAAIETGKDSGSIARILNSSLMPSTVLFAW